jgi:hypothetical protein
MILEEYLAAAQHGWRDQTVQTDRFYSEFA